MGTINYGTSDYITIGYNCNNIDYEDEFYNDFISDEFEQINDLLEDEDFVYFRVRIEPGYYEGYYINIVYDGIDTYEEKLLAQKEITRIRAFLTRCISEFGCVAVYPGWCTGYADHKKTLHELSAAIKEMREEVRRSPTWRKRFI